MDKNEAPHEDRYQKIASQVSDLTAEVKVPESFLPDLPPSLRKAMKAADNIRRRISAMRRAATPMPGIYWWIPIPDENRTSVSAWKLSPFNESAGRDVLHANTWRTVLGELSAFWKKPLSAAIDDYTALPRGRVTEVQGKGTRMVYKVLHGGDTPPNSGGLSHVKAIFNLPLSAPTGKEPHEMMDKQHHDHLFSLLGLAHSGFKHFMPQSEYDLD